MVGVIKLDLGELERWVFSFEKNLYSGLFYEQLDTYVNPNHYNEYCGTVSNPAYKNRNVRNICAKILNYLKTIYSTSDNTKNEYDVCKLLNYWVFKCKPDRAVFDYDDWEKRKELYDYFVNIDSIRRIAEVYDLGCDEYYKYVKYKQKLYDYYENFCSIHVYTKCPKFLENSKKYDPKIVLPKFKCYDQMIKSEEKQEQELSASAPPPETSITEIPDSSTPVATKAGNALLGVVVTSMTSGALYKVRNNFINT
ncbi:hypothetical protein PVBG_04021 [Plasmodium vivax Brazil I]|uniref:Uncharacterized protein n=1 Tax=Plasmodium vivax (strain Brazil I) TaxID=1033975 RepID=A0A0J9SWL4_PLAV1|nr:hypothetical protein PVBG_04021 [Plasmodium vivax Brazil I]